MTRRALVVEDEAPIARGIARLIGRACPDVLVVVVAAAELAVAELAAWPFDLIVSDFNLAGSGTGADVLAFARTSPTPIPFVFVSSDQAAAQFDVPCFEKPCEMQALRSVIADLLAVQTPAIGAAS